MRISDWSSDVCSSDLLTGGGLKVKHGEVSLAHLGVLFLDELPEFQRAVLDSLRQPLETGSVDVARAKAQERKSVGKGKSVKVRVELGGRRDIKKKTNRKNKNNIM